MIRQLNAHFTIPRHAATQCFVHRFRQNAGFRRLPVTVEVYRNLVGFCPFFGGKIHVQRLIKPACCQWFTLQIAIDKAEFTAQIFQGAVEWFDKQTVITQRHFTFRGYQLAVQRDIKM
ncbi:hypothetical protein HmCmsJML003_00984 [Escherichia coli]|nr:hypothetical protein HmCmsJML003_00984 [Escherichia coli]